jgi:hypothetical protein
VREEGRGDLGVGRGRIRSQRTIHPQQEEEVFYLVVALNGWIICKICCYSGCDDVVRAAH